MHLSHWRGPAIAAVLAALAGHLALVHAYPRVVMSAAMQQLSHGGERVNTWLHAQPVTPESRKVVRPAPEFVYSACVYDLSDGPLRIRVTPSSRYWSLSLYADNTDNFATLRDVDYGDGVDLKLVAGDTNAQAGVLQAPAVRGIALVRRLVTDDAQWQLVRELRKEDICRPIEAS